MDCTDVNSWFLSLIMVAKYGYGSLSLSLLDYQFLSFQGIWLQRIFTVMACNCVPFTTPRILPKIGYSLPVFLQMVSLLGVSKPGKH